MEKCEQCGNAYAHTFHVMMGEEDHVFDSFECAIEKLAPRCSHCSTRIVGHGVESDDKLFCCANCARDVGITGLKDHERNEGA